MDKKPTAPVVPPPDTAAPVAVHLDAMRQRGLHWTGAPDTTLLPPGGRPPLPGRDLTGDEARSRIPDHATLVWALAAGFTLGDPPPPPKEATP